MRASPIATAFLATLLVAGAASAQELDAAGEARIGEAAPSFGLWSLDAMEAYRRVNALVWQNPVGTVALYASFVVHGGLALSSLFRRTTLRMPWWEALQLTLGLLIPPLIAISTLYILDDDGDLAAYR